MVQEIKIDDNLTLEFRDMTSNEYIDMTMQVPDVEKDSFSSEKEYENEKKKRNIEYMNGVAERIFYINDVKINVGSLFPYQMGVIHDLVSGYISSVNSKKAWDLKGGEKRIEDLRENEEKLKNSKEKTKNYKKE